MYVDVLLTLADVYAIVIYSIPGTMCRAGGALLRVAGCSGDLHLALECVPVFTRQRIFDF